MERERLREKGDDESINELSFRSKSAIDLLLVGKAPWKSEEGSTTFISFSTTTGLSIVIGQIGVADNLLVSGIEKLICEISEFVCIEVAIGGGDWELTPLLSLTIC